MIKRTQNIQEVIDGLASGKSVRVTGDDLWREKVVKVLGGVPSELVLRSRDQVRTVPIEPSMYFEMADPL